MDRGVMLLIAFALFIIVTATIVGVTAQAAYGTLNANPANLPTGSLAAIGLATCMVLIGGIAGILYKWPTAIGDIANVLSSFQQNKVYDYWVYIAPAVIISLIVTYGVIATVCKAKNKATPSTISNTINVQQAAAAAVAYNMGNTIQPVTSRLIGATAPYTIEKNLTALLNWCPMTVRLAGYLECQTGGADNGAFDLSTDSSSVVGNNSIALALKLGARAFVFDIDYYVGAPCVPVIMYQNESNGKNMGLNKGSIFATCTSLAAKAFSDTQSDPVLIIIYIRRFPPSTLQKTMFLEGIAKGLLPLAPNHLGSTDNGNFHNCQSETLLFTLPISAYQSKFIVLTNYDTTLIEPTPDPRNNLNFWTNARIWQDDGKVGSTIGSVSTTTNTSRVAQVGEMSQYLTMSSSDAKKYGTDNKGKFTIALGPMGGTPTLNDVTTLISTCGIQCVPLDVLALSKNEVHKKNIWEANITAIGSLGQHTNVSAVTGEDPLVYWLFAGWAYKDTTDNEYTIQSFTGSMTPNNIYVIPTAVVPTKPSPAMNVNGGLVSIS